MTKTELEILVKNALTQCADENGWANFAKIGTKLRKQEVKYGKLSRFLKDFEDLVETRIDTAITPPTAYAKLKL